MKKNEPIEKKKSKTGRPTIYSEILADKICEAVATTPMGIEKICKMRGNLPHPDTIREWRLKYPSFSAKYAHAKMLQADILAESCIDIADDCSNDIKTNHDGHETFNSEFVARSRLRIDTRKWLASKLLPKQYGEKIMLEQKTEENEKLKEEIKMLREHLDKENNRDF